MAAQDDMGDEEDVAVAQEGVDRVVEGPGALLAKAGAGDVYADYECPCFLLASVGF